MPMSAGGAPAAPLRVSTRSLPMATPCSFTPCSAPHSHNGRDSSTAAVGLDSTCRYCVRSTPLPLRRAWASGSWTSDGGRSEFLANSVPCVPTTHRVSHTSASQRSRQLVGRPLPRAHGAIHVAAPHGGGLGPGPVDPPARLAQRRSVG